jgi:hypothetical protein
MNNKEKMLPFERLGMARRSLRKNRGIRETNLPFSKIFLKDNHRLETDRCPFSVGVVIRTTST